LIWRIASVRRRISSGSERFWMSRISWARTGWPGGASPRPAICPSYPITPASRKPARRVTARAKATACSGVCSGERRVPMCTAGLRASGMLAQ
jgi:hypothetical protein